jgi:hypothetical protein
VYVQERRDGIYGPSTTNRARVHDELIFALRLQSRGIGVSTLAEPEHIVAPGFSEPLDELFEHLLRIRDKVFVSNSPEAFRTQLGTVDLGSANVHDPTSSIEVSSPMAVLLTVGGDYIPRVTDDVNELTIRIELVDICAYERVLGAFGSPPCLSLARRVTAVKLLEGSRARPTATLLL